AHAAIASPEPSVRSPRAPASETVRIPSRVTCRLTSCRRRPASPRLPHGAILPERSYHHLGGNPLPAALDLEPGAGLRRIRRQERGADGGAQRRALGAAAHLVHLLALVPHRIPLPRDTAAKELEAHQLPG